MTGNEVVTRLLLNMEKPNALPWRVDKLMPVRRNAVRCILCDTVIVSRHQHDFVSCPCGAIFTDGGDEYVRRGGALEAMSEVLEWRPMGWYSHRWKARRAVRRAFGGFEQCRVVQVPGDEFVGVWRALDREYSEAVKK